MTMKKIVLPEGDSQRVLSAAQGILNQGICHPVLIGDAAHICGEIEAPLESYTVLASDSTELDRLQAAAAAKGKELRVSDASLVQGAALVRDGYADGIVGGAQTGTDEVFLAYIKTIGVHEDVSRVTSCFLMEKDNQRFIFADCALNPESNASELAETAYLSAQFAKTVGIEEPVVAFLSFQTVGNAPHPLMQLPRDAAKIARETYALCANGPLQFDAALLPDVAKRKTKDCDVAGHANVFIFPDLESGNIGYKIAERMGGFTATGPLFLGFRKPAYDLSRGCSVEDIISVVRMAVQHAE